MADHLPEVFNFEGLVVRAFPSAYAASFSYLPQSARRSTPAVVRRVYAAAAKYAVEDADCSVCGAPAPAPSRILIAVEVDGDQNIGCVCAACKIDV